MRNPPTANINKPFLSLQDVSFNKFKGPVFNNLNWHVRQNETWVITGPGGSGKTTLAEALVGQHRITKGTLKYYFLPEQENTWNLKKYVGFISFPPSERLINYGKFYYQQRFNSSDTEGIVSVTEFLQNTTGVTAQDELWAHVVKLMNLRDLLHLEIIKLSNGQTRKMLIAQALLRQPKLLILDNPFAGLDKQARHDLEALVKNLIQHDTELILITDQHDIPVWATHVLHLNNFSIQGAYTRAEYLNKNIADTAEEKRNNLPGVNTIFQNHQAAPDFKVAVKMENTTITYDGKRVLNNITWTVNQGEKWVLLGPNGSGKTTLLSLINGDNPQAFANKIYLFDRRKGTGESIWDIKRRIGFISPELHLYFRQNLLAETVAATGYTDTLFPKGQLTPQQEQTLHHFFAYYEIGHLQKKHFLQLSAGEQRLVLLIRSLVKNPEMLIWDEPFQGLSADLIQKTQELLSAYATPAKTVIFVSHYEHEIPTWINKRIYLEQGQMKELI
ncbi:ATP-binding cassette domain-containing protein [Adhaeribacter rhizoryzae]|uniref:ATP-binding cassette domain-containing protein n=1 Tax=Adhaeribacter rhizoryzae TaxID=2607907 RepID=A0A5M6DP13_9BACT|nr:ATP-binding cassette domain-containing protein [Adhaeribacter rhizoryzae]KAA5547989.1 ATP-binding cassette domain-containing protein [Adhaeribacter rhizoryzae]